MKSPIQYEQSLSEPYQRDRCLKIDQEMPILKCTDTAKKKTKKKASMVFPFLFILVTL